LFTELNPRLRNFCSVAISVAGVGATNGPIMLIPAYDPVAIAVMGFGIILAAWLALPF
jgi:hypothetical protein